MSEIVSIVYKPENLPDKPTSYYARVTTETATLVENYGIEGDRKGGHPKRQLNLMSYETLQELGSEGFKVQPGDMGEQMIVKGFDVNTLAVGDRLQIGDTACIEVTDYRNGCDRFEALQGKAPVEAKGRLGVMAKVVTSGKIGLGDAVRVLNHV